MQVDIVGRIRNLQLPVTQPLIPLFECLVNSIEAIEDAGISDGRIDVYLGREPRQAALAGNEETLWPLFGTSQSSITVPVSMMAMSAPSSSLTQLER